MRCPYCGYNETKVIDKRESGKNNEITRRRRECLKCHKRFTTYEKAEDINLFVIKKDGKREEFDKDKILRGIYRSCEKRPISQEQMEEVANKVELEIRNMELKEIKSSKVGQIVMKHLKKLDKVAYIRFASVYKEFADIEEFKMALDKLK